MSDSMNPNVEGAAGHLLGGVPHAAGIGLHVISIGDGVARCRVPYAPHLVGDPETGIVHGGVVTSLLDNTSGIAVSAATRRFGQIATLDLRIDYMKPATPGEAILAECHCYKVTKNIAFVRGVAFHSDPADPIAASTAAFMIGANEGKAPGANLKPQT
jgi:uncharacterized protein (TIGR00369 family)